MMKNEISKHAQAYARATTSTRCIRMGDCSGCMVRSCDYRSRAEAYVQGWNDCQLIQQTAKTQSHEDSPQ